MSHRFLALLGIVTLMHLSTRHALADPETLTPCAAEPLDMSVSYGDKASCEITPASDTDLFRFPGVAGERVLIVVARTSGGDACIDLRRPDGTRITGPACSNANGFPGSHSAAIESILDQTGMHLVIVSEAGNATTGGYAISIDRINPPPANAVSSCFGCARSDMIAPATDFDFFVVEGTEGSVVSLLAARTSGADVCVQLRRPDGTIRNSAACSNTNGFPGSNSAGFESTLDQSGVHVVMVSAAGNAASVNYNLSLQCIAGTCVLPPSCNGQPASIWGTDEDNVLVGTEASDIIAARGGNDIIYGLGGDDLICGDAGNDLIFGGGGNDRILAGRGDDLLFGQGDDDRLSGSAGNDLLSGGGGDDNMNGGSGSDVCDGGPHVFGDSAAGNCEQKPGVP